MSWLVNGNSLRNLGFIDAIARFAMLAIDPGQAA
jgi:hypothetical protein